MERKVVVVTGASAGLGRAIASHFAKNGHSLGLISRNEARLNSLKTEIESYGCQACIALCDVANYNQVESAATLIEKTLGPIDIWINNAMASVFSPLIEMEPEEFKRVTEVTYLGYVYGTLAALKRMKKGKIIQVGSALSYRSIPLQSAYCGAKHAVKGFTDSLRCELIHEKSEVKITMIQMPALNTPQFNWVKSRLPRKASPVPPIFQPEVGAKAIYWIAFHNRREWVLGAMAQLAIMTSKLFPALLDRYLAKKGYDSQQYNGQASNDHPNNLFSTVEGNFGSHGDFDHKSKSYSYQFWFSKYRLLLISILIILVVVLYGTH